MSLLSSCDLGIYPYRRTTDHSFLITALLPCTLNVSVHWSHLKGLNPLWAVSTCISRLNSVVNHLWQVSHWWCPAWFPIPCRDFLCLIKWPRCTNAEAHLSHLKGRSPVWRRIWACEFDKYTLNWGYVRRRKMAKDQYKNNHMSDFLRNMEHCINFLKS